MASGDLLQLEAKTAHHRVIIINLPKLSHLSETANLFTPRHPASSDPGRQGLKNMTDCQTRRRREGGQERT